MMHLCERVVQIILDARLMFHYRLERNQYHRQKKRPPWEENHEGRAQEECTCRLDNLRAGYVAD